MEFFEEILTRNVDKVYPNKDSLLKKLNSDQKLTIYLGVDPSSPKIHLGHSVVLRKLREFQVLGHKIILLIGDFTGMIGDPTGKDSARKPLTKAEVLSNSSSYKSQASKILSFTGKNPAEITYNSHWLGKMDFEDILKLASRFTVAQLLERDMFQKRIVENKPIALHEFLYPLMQGYDSVALNVDLEIGGTDQTFNMLVGRQLVETLNKKQKFVLTIPLLEGSDGRKMSKSFNNSIDIDETNDQMFAKIMSIKDSLILKYFEMCTLVTTTELKKIRTSLEKQNPIEIKKELARAITSLYHSAKETTEAEAKFERIVQKKDLTEVIEEQELALSQLESPITFASIATSAGLTRSNSEASRLSSQGGFFVDGVKINNVREALVENILGKGFEIRTGKRRIKRIKIVE